MYKLDLKDKVFNELKLPEIFALAISEKLDKPYDECLKLLEALTEEKIKSVEKTFFELGQQSNISIDKPKDIDDFIKGNDVIKG